MINKKDSTKNTLINTESEENKKIFEMKKDYLGNPFFIRKA